MAMQELLTEIENEAARQDGKYGPLQGDEPGRTRLALAFIEDEVKEALDAWHEERTRIDRPHTRAEVLQVAGLCLRALRDTM